MLHKLTLLLPLALTGLLVFACSDDDDSPQDTARDNAEVCADVARARESFNEVMLNAVTFNESELQDTLPIARSDLDSLSASVREAQGGGTPASIEQLGEDIQEFQRLMATPQLASVATELRASGEAINSDLDQIAADSNCPPGN